MFFAKLAVGLLLGAAIGALLGRTGSCESGSCPLTANPLRGAVWCGFLGLMVAISLQAGPSKAGKTEKAVPRDNPKAEAESGIVDIASLDQFQKRLADGPAKTVVDFYATWCAPCKAYAPILEQLAKEEIVGVGFVKVDVDQAQDIVQEYNIKAMPTTIVFERGKEVRRMMGVQSNAALKEALGQKR